MPLENINEGKSTTQAGSVDPMRWAEAAAIVLENAPVKGPLGDRLRAHNNAEILMAGELEKMSSEEFDAIDANANGFVSKDETKSAIDKAPPGAKKDVLQFLQNNINDFEEQSNDEWFDENSGVSKKDLESLKDSVAGRFDESCAIGLRQALKNENLSDVISIVRQTSDRVDRLPDILKSTGKKFTEDKIARPSLLAPISYHIGLNSTTKNVDGKAVGEVDISHLGFHLKISTDETTPVVATLNRNPLFSNKELEQKPSQVMGEIGTAARMGPRVNEKLDVWKQLIKEQAEKMQDKREEITPEKWDEAMAILAGDKPATGALGERLREKHEADLLISTAMEKFVDDGFESADKDKNGFLTKNEIDNAIANTSDRATKDVLQYSKNNYNDLESVSSKDLDTLTGNGISKDDFSNYRKHLSAQFDNELAWGLRKSLSEENLTDLDSVVKEMKDRLHRLEYITKKATFDSGNSNLKFESKVVGSPLLEVGRIDIKYPRNSILELSTKFEPKGYQWIHKGFLSSEMKMCKPQTALDSLGDEARKQH